MALKTAPPPENWSALIRESLVWGGVVVFFFFSLQVSDYSWTYSRKSMNTSKLYFLIYSLFFFYPSNNLLCKNLFGLQNRSFGLCKTLNWNLWWWSICQCHAGGEKTDPWKRWSCVPVLAQPKAIPLELNCSLEPVGVSCAFCLVTFGVLCQAQVSSVPAAPPGRGPSRWLPFSLYTVTASYSDPCGFQRCCRGGSSAAL